MRNKRETDISSYKASENPRKSDGSVKRFFKGLGKIVLTVFTVLVIAGLITGVSLGIYIFHLASEPTGIDLKAKSLNQTSIIYVKDTKSGEFVESRKLYGVENRIWVSNQDIPDYMKEAQIAIEDKRFYDHPGVDWKRTFSAVFMLATGKDQYGGSTITQQLIKNITDDNEVSINRKLREICKALKLEKEYTKDQILEAYLNVVNFGNNCQGVEAAAQLYFDKSIKDCSLAECAAIAGITQNPSRWNPLLYPNNNKERRELILSEMLDQGKITQSEYDSAMNESAVMTFVGFKSASEQEDDEEDFDNVQSWYEDQIFYDLKRDLAQYYNISEGAASEKIYTEGLKIYSAVDTNAQEYLQEAALNMDVGYDYDLQLGAVMMEFDGRVIATVGSSKRKTGNLEWDRASHSVLQPGSSIKPLLVYPLGIESHQLYYSSIVPDKEIEKYSYDAETGTYKSGPGNWYEGNNGDMLLPDAIEWSSNNTAVQVLELIGGPSVPYEQAVTRMGFSNLSEEDSRMAGALTLGGMHGGVTVREMAAAYTFMGNGGLYYKPYTYFYVTDSEDNVIIDNRDTIPKKAYSPETATIMNRLLNYNMENTVHTKASWARVEGWDIVGKTGTTNADYDSWYCGLSPYCVMAIWTGFDDPHTILDTTHSTKFFGNVMGHYLEGREQKEYKLSSKCIPATYNPVTGLIISTENVSGKYVGYYTEDNMPSFGSPYWEDSTDYGSGSDDTDDDSSTDHSDSGGGSDQSDVSGGDDSSDAGNSGEQPPESSAEQPPESSAEQPPESGGGGEQSAESGA